MLVVVVVVVVLVVVVLQVGRRGLGWGGAWGTRSEVGKLWTVGVGVLWITRMHSLRCDSRCDLWSNLLHCQCAFPGADLPFFVVHREMSPHVYGREPPTLVLRTWVRVPLPIETH